MRLGMAPVLRGGCRSVDGVDEEDEGSCCCWLESSRIKASARSVDDRRCSGFSVGYLFFIGFNLVIVHYIRRCISVMLRFNLKL